MRRLRRITVAGALALLAVPSVAHAASIDIQQSLLSGGKFRYKAAYGELNRVRITQSSTAVTVSDPGASIGLESAAGLCIALDLSNVTCTVPLDYDFRVETLDGDDTVHVDASSGFRIEGGDGDDVLSGGSGPDKIIGGAGNDILAGGGGPDRIVGGTGDDVVDYSDRTAGVFSSPDGVANDGAAGEGDDIDSSVEGAIGGAGDDTLVASSAGGTLVGGPGDDTLQGGDGPDVLDGGPGVDSLSGGAGADRIYSRDDAAEAPACGSGSDQVFADLADTPLADCEVVEVLAAGAPGDWGGLGSIGGSSTGGETGSGESGGAGDSGSAPAAPRRGLSVNLYPGNGAIRVKPPGSDEWVDVAGDSAIPVGAVIDATHGRVTITSAVDASGKTQTATFWGGKFAIRQRRNSPVVDIALRGGDFSGCGRRARAGSGTAVAARGRARRRLWSRDRRGRYRTKGRHSVATVRGTRWLTEDRCGGTLTRVTEGAVSVRALGRRKKVLVRAGERYLARRR